MSFNFAKTIQNFWHTIVQETEKDVIEYATPAIKYIEANGGKAVLALAEAALTAAVAGTPWATVTATLLASAQGVGIQLAEGAAGAILNFAKANLVAQGTPTA